MGFFVIRRGLAVRGGSVDLGADVNIYRDAANRLKTDDAFSVGGTANFAGSAIFGSVATFGGSTRVSGSPFVTQYGIVDTTTVVNGELAIRHVVHVPSIVLQSGGTTYTVALPPTTHGTVTVTVGS